MHPLNKNGFVSTISFSESCFEQRRFRGDVKKTIGIAERNAMQLNIMYSVLKNRSFIKIVLNSVINKYKNTCTIIITFCNPLWKCLVHVRN